LKIHPQARRSAKSLPKIERRIRRHAPLSADKFIEPSFRPSDLPRKGCLRNLSWLQKFLQENLPGMKRIHRLQRILLGHLEPQPFRHLMIIHHSDLSRVTPVPSKYETQLVIDADRMKTSPFALERLKSISGRDTQIIQLRCIMQIQQLTPGRSPQLRRKTSRFPRLSIEE
jgi:hypothetical protein